MSTYACTACIWSIRIRWRCPSLYRLHIHSQARLGSGPSAELFLKEFLAGIQRVNYNQGNGLNALAGPG